MKEIQLTQGKVAIVDDEDYEKLSSLKWHVSKLGSGMKKFYACRAVRTNGSVRNIFMHALLIDIPEGLFCDHINGNSLDNRKENLRACTRSQNNQNRNMRSDNTSGFKGVVWHKYAKKWLARISCLGKNYCLGYFNSPEEAALVYKESAEKLFGEYAFRD